jgi:hypothetical protein
MKRIGQFKSARWGEVIVQRATYDGPKGPTAVVLQLDNGEKLGTLSVNMYRPECSHDSRDLPADCFYVKQWAENETLAAEALQSGIFQVREDLPHASSGYVTAPVWQIKEPTVSAEARWQVQEPQEY